MKKISRPAQPLNPTSSPARSGTTSSMMAASSPLARNEVFYEEATVPAQYPHRLSLYLNNPGYEITIEDFEQLALARLECKLTVIVELYLLF